MFERGERTLLRRRGAPRGAHRCPSVYVLAPGEAQRSPREDLRFLGENLRSPA
jgi:hypothetical protein